MVYVLYGLLFVSFLLGYWVIGSMLFKRGLLVRRMMHEHVLADGTKQTKQDPHSKRKPEDKLKDIAGKFGTFGVFGTLSKNLKEELRRADIPLRAEEFVGFSLLIAILCAILSIIFTRSAGLTVMVLLIAMMVPFLIIRVMQKRRTNKFNDQLVDMLTVTANSLKSGYSFQQAIQMIANETPAPMSVEFHRLLREISLGMDTEEALQGLNERMNSKDLDLILTAIMIQRQTGGNLAEILEGISSTIRDRIQVKREIMTITGQARASGYVLMGLPFLLAIMLGMMSPDIYQFALSTTEGLVAVGVIIFFQVISAILIRIIVNIEV